MSAPYKVKGCAASEFGCCQDGLTAAGGSSYEGCPTSVIIVGGCESTRWGCCYDGMSAASGPDNIGF